MKRELVYYDENGILTLTERDTDLSNVRCSRLLKGKDAVNHLTNIFNDKIEFTRRIAEDEKVVQFSNYFVRLGDYHDIKSDASLKPLMNILNKYEKGKMDDREKKVKRVNKYTFRRLVAAGLLAGLISGTAVGIKALSGGKKTNAEEMPFINSNIADEDNIPTVNIYDENISESSPTIEATDESYVPTPTVSPTPTATAMPTPTVTPTAEPINEVKIEYEDRTNTEDAKNTTILYKDIIEANALQYGLDPNVVLAIATQERGVHSSTIDPGGATGLMQIQNAAWIGETIKAYNFNTQQEEKLLITQEGIADLNTNIKIGCMIFQSALKEVNYNIIAAIQNYNYGVGNMNKLLSYYMDATNKTKEEILNDPLDCGWLEYRNYIKAGDKKYVEHILSYVGDNPNLTFAKQDGTLVNINVRNTEAVKSANSVNMK